MLCVVFSFLNLLIQNDMKYLDKKDFCDKGIHWYVGVYRCGFWVYNECSICKKRQEL